MSEPFLVFLCMIVAVLVSVQGAEKSPTAEIDVGKILWKSHANTELYFGKTIKVLPPRIPAEGWEYQYKGGNGTVGTKDQVLLVGYRYKKKPKDWKEALRKVELPTSVPPVDAGTSYIWSAVGTIERHPIRFKGRTLNRVVLAKDFSEILIDGHEPGTY